MRAEFSENAQGSYECLLLRPETERKNPVRRIGFPPPFRGKKRPKAELKKEKTGIALRKDV